MIPASANTNQRSSRDEREFKMWCNCYLWMVLDRKIPGAVNMNRPVRLQE